MSMPIVHHVTIPCLESLLGSSSKGTVVTTVPSLAALGTFLLLLGVILYLSAHFDSFSILLPMNVSVLSKVRDYLPNGCLFLSPPWDMVLYLLCNPVICTSSLQCLLPLHKFDVLKGSLGVEACNFLDCEQFLFLQLTISIKGCQSGLIS